ncbi:unnamed protein product [Effrenium voratum]|nr:unnamed protein product [Effrenium voratum]
MSVLQSAVSFEHCEATEGGGAGIMNRNGSIFAGPGAHLSFRSCSAHIGAGIYVFSRGQLFQSAGTMTFTDCTARRAEGGAIFAREIVQGPDARMDLLRCSAPHAAGGGIHGILVLLAGVATFEQMSATYGGAIRVEKSLILKGNISIRSATAAATGGAILSRRVFLKGGEIRMRHTSALEQGGAISANFLNLYEGEMHLQDTYSPHSGAIACHNRMRQLGGRLSISNASAEYAGGIATAWMLLEAGQIHISDVVSRGVYSLGGAFTIEKGAVLGEHAELIIENAFSGGGGGAIAARLFICRGNLTVRNAEAFGAGGGVYVKEMFRRDRKFHLQSTETAPSATTARLATDLISKWRNGTRTATLLTPNLLLLWGKTSFQSCRAQWGGAIFSAGDVRLATAASFVDCTTRDVRSGAAIHARRLESSVDLLVANCTSPEGGVIITTFAVDLPSADFINTTAPQVVSYNFTAEKLRFTGGSNGVMLMAHHRQLGEVSCDNGLEGHVDDFKTECRPCRMGYFQLRGAPHITNTTVFGHECVKAPKGSMHLPNGLRIRPGYMVDQSNVSVSLHCPNQMACPGGNITSSGWTPMCREGYAGLGCTECNYSTHGRAVNDPFDCTFCAEQRSVQLLQWARFVLQHSVLFAVSASGVIFSGQESYKSTILTNQLMSYVTVSVPVICTVSNSQSFHMLTDGVQAVVEALSLPVDIANSGSGEGQSVQCLLGYVGISKTLYNADILVLVLAICLLLCLARSVDFCSAIVVTANCYLPRLCFAFGRHLVCYRLEMEKKGGALHCGFGEDASVSRPVALALAVTAFTLGCGSWMTLIYLRRLIPSPGISYLISPYTEECTMWEVSVLARKMLIMFTTAVYPSTLNPAMQMEWISVILLTALIATLRKAPYVSKDWNLTEEILLALSLLMVITTSCFHANETYWARDDRTQNVTMLGILTLAVGPAMVMSLRITVELIREVLEMFSENAETEGEKGQ